MTHPKASKRFGAPYISTKALPSKHPGLKAELEFEREVATEERDAFKTLHDGGDNPQSIRGSVKRLHELGG